MTKLNDTFFITYKHQGFAHLAHKPTVNEGFDFWRNQAWRDATILAVIGDQVLFEYYLPAGTSAMLLIEVDGQGKCTEPKNVAYKACPWKWIEAISAAGLTWDGCGQQSIWSTPFPSALFEATIEQAKAWEASQEQFIYSQELLGLSLIANGDRYTDKMVNRLEDIFTQLLKEKTMKFEDTKERFELINKIVDRALALLSDARITTDKMSLSMDIDYCDQDTRLDLEKFLAFDDVNFSHDVFGIYYNFNRQTLKMDNCFLPRCSA